MGILIDKDTRVLVQGMTGKEGARATKEMLAYGTKVTCGVTPGKGGLEVEGLPIFDAVEEALQFDKKLNTSVLYVPPLMVYDAAMEAIDAGVKTICIITENVPVKDSAKLVAYAKTKGVRIIGPSSVGVITPGVGKLGSIGGSKETDMYTKGNIGVISKSGGMSAETSLLLTQNGLGQSTVVGIGGDVIIGTTFADLLKEFENDKDTKAIVLFGEIGGQYEELAAECVMKKEITKPIVAFVSGRFAESLGRSLSLGHAGAIIENGSGTNTNKRKVMKKAGIIVADYHYEIPDLIKKVLK